MRVIADDGAQLGVMVPQEAIRLAREQGLDLVEVAPLASPPVCRIMDFNKFKYEQTKREREAKKKHHVARLKEVKFKPHIEDHDYQVKLQQLKRFLMRGDKAKVTLVFRGRELAHIPLGRRVLERLTGDLGGVGLVERNPVLEGRFMTMIIQPDHAGIKRAKKEQAKAVRAASSSASPVMAQEPTIQPGAQAGENVSSERSEG